MLSKDKMDRINELSKKSKTTGLSIEEAKEQTTLRKEYLETFRSSMKGMIENVTILDPNGEDVTPDKVKESRNKNLLN
ncbi:DUF896 domain-containing protein [Paenisporosarcina cavernae]|uniref:UPF0291 protein D3873_05325 n=1 Tax=Paenisporosarcina cavernae TaxID=2320858 RepID=A0A385YSQ1_9BACL|nr:DUF896 domain-containing protein [Paenisporosarcina cavernae]AYC29330.1 DUF896 domain-containing protein [Paenisporosarcina cavernae]